MNNLLLEKLEELFKELDNCPDVIEMKNLKEEIYKDKELKILLDKYKEMHMYDPCKTDIKKEIINNELVKKYRVLEDELYFAILEMNQKLNSLFDKKRCNSEDN